MVEKVFIGSALRGDLFDQIFPVIQPLVRKFERWQDDFSVADFYDDTQAGRLSTHLFYDQTGCPLGLLALELVEEALFVRAMVTFSGHFNAYPSIFEQVDHMARRVSRNKLMFASPRKGWIRNAPKLGWVYDSERDLYTREVANEIT